MRPVQSPSYCHHTPKNLAYVRLGGEFIYLGTYGSPESKIKYERLVAEWLGRGRIATNGSGDDPELSVNAVLLTYVKFAQSFYRNSEGTPTLELDKIAQAIGPLKTLYGETPAAAFGPVALKAVRQKMIESNLARTTVNQRVSCIRRIFKWAVSEELLPPSVYHGLQAVDGLKRGRCAARETDPVRPVPEAHIDAVLPFLCLTLRAMVQVQRYTGMRSGELCLLRACDLDMSSDPWA